MYIAVNLLIKFKNKTMLKRTLLFGIAICISQMLMAQKWFPVKGNTKTAQVFAVANTNEKIAIVAFDQKLLVQEFSAAGKNLATVNVSTKNFGRFFMVEKEGLYIGDKIVIGILGRDMGEANFKPGLIIVNTENSSYKYKELSTKNESFQSIKLIEFNGNIIAVYATVDAKIKIFILDQELNIDTKFEEKITAAKKSLEINSLLSNNDNMVYIGYGYDGNNFSLLQYMTGDNESNGIDIKPEKVLSNVSFSMLKNGNLLASGMWSPKSKKEAHGFFSLKIDGDNLEPDKAIFTTFSKEIFSTFGIDAAKGKGIKEINNRQSLKDEEGNLYRFFEISYSTISGNGNFTGFEEDVFIAKFNNNGELQWQDILIRKNSYKDGAFYLSFNPLIFNDELVVFYNDHSDNVNVDKQKDLKSTAKGNFSSMTTYALKYDENGKSKKEVFFDYQNRSFMYCPTSFRKLDENLLYVEQASRPVIYGKYIGKFGVYKY